jgi:peptidoglycan/LPS O-acetylase OafA/YrhL
LTPTAGAKSPLAVLWNGNAAVCVFFILSGYVMTEFATSTALSLPAQAIRRYLRVAIPILIASSFAWLLLRYGLMRNAVNPDVTGGWLGSWYRFEPSFPDMIQEALFGTFATGSNAYNCNLWTMNAELAGSLYIMLFCAIARSRLERTPALCASRRDTLGRLSAIVRGWRAAPRLRASAAPHASLGGDRAVRGWRLHLLPSVRAARYAAALACAAARHLLL